MNAWFRDELRDVEVSQSQLTQSAMSEVSACAGDIGVKWSSTGVSGVEKPHRTDVKQDLCVQRSSLSDTRADGKADGNARSDTRGGDAPSERGIDG